MHQKLILFFSSFLFAISLLGQRDLTPSRNTKRTHAFGKVDTRNFTNYGFQVSLGPTYMLTKKANTIHHIDANDSNPRPIEYWHDPQGKWGGFGEFGMAHFNEKDISKVRLKLFKKRIISYYDWGIGFKYLGGKEVDTINYLSNTGDSLSIGTGYGDFNIGNVYGRFTFHNTMAISEKLFLDNGLGINLDYRVLDGNKVYNGFSIPETQTFSKKFAAQLHYDFGIGIVVKRGRFLIPGIQIPIFGFYEWNHGSPKLQWYSSTYRPLLIKVKYIWKLEKKSNGCSQGSEEDRKRNQQYMQGN